MHNDPNNGRSFYSKETKTTTNVHDTYTYIYIYIYDDAVILTSEMHEHLTEGTGVEPAKHPPKVKSVIFLQL